MGYQNEGCLNRLLAFHPVSPKEAVLDSLPSTSAKKKKGRAHSVLWMVALPPSALFRRFHVFISCCDDG